MQEIYELRLEISALREGKTDTSPVFGVKMVTTDSKMIEVQYICIGSMYSVQVS